MNSENIACHIKKRLPFEFQDATIFAVLLHQGLPPTADGCLPFEGVMHMVTYEGLFSLIVAICAIISIVISFGSMKKVVW